MHDRDGTIRKIEYLPNGLVRVETRSGLTGTFHRDGTPNGGDVSRMSRVKEIVKARLADDPRN